MEDDKFSDPGSYRGKPSPRASGRSSIAGSSCRWSAWVPVTRTTVSSEFSSVAASDDGRNFKSVVSDPGHIYNSARNDDRMRKSWGAGDRGRRKRFREIARRFVGRAASRAKTFGRSATDILVRGRSSVQSFSSTDVHARFTSPSGESAGDHVRTNSEAALLSRPLRYRPSSDFEQLEDESVGEHIRGRSPGSGNEGDGDWNTCLPAMCFPRTRTRKDSRNASPRETSWSRILTECPSQRSSVSSSRHSSCSGSPPISPVSRHTFSTRSCHCACSSPMSIATCSCGSFVYPRTICVGSSGGMCDLCSASSTRSSSPTTPASGKRTSGRQFSDSEGFIVESGPASAASDASTLELERCDMYFLFASPLGAYCSPASYPSINIEAEVELLTEMIEESRAFATQPPKVRLSVGVATSSSLSKLMMLSRTRRDVVLHLSAHSDGNGGLILEDGCGNGGAHVLPRDKLRQFLTCGGQGLQGISLLFLSSCNSLELAQLFVDCGCQYVIATSRDVLDTAAREFGRYFYGALFAGESLQSAFTSAQQTLRISSKPIVAQQADHFTLLSNSEGDPSIATLQSLCGCPGLTCSTEIEKGLQNLVVAQHVSLQTLGISQLAGFEDASLYPCVLSLLPSRIEDFYRPPEMQQVMHALSSKRVCLVSGVEGAGKTALGIEISHFAAAPGRLFSYSVLHVPLAHAASAIEAIQASFDALDESIGTASPSCFARTDRLSSEPSLGSSSPSPRLSSRLSCSSLASSAASESDHCFKIRRVVQGFQQLERRRKDSRLLMVLDDEEGHSMIDDHTLRQLLTELLRKTHRLSLLILTRMPVLTSLGAAKVVNVPLRGLDPYSAAQLFLSRVHRPLTQADFMPSAEHVAASSSNVRHSWAQSCQTTGTACTIVLPSQLSRTEVVKQIVDSSLLKRLGGNPSLVRKLGAAVAPGSLPAAMLVGQILREGCQSHSVSTNAGCEY